MLLTTYTTSDVSHIIALIFALILGITFFVIWLVSIGAFNNHTCDREKCDSCPFPCERRNHRGNT